MIQLIVQTYLLKKKSVSHKRAETCFYLYANGFSVTISDINNHGSYFS